ncbi:signal peptidase I [Natronomonas salina]|uniref:signal peptidase I n=1 Tax=Natronomonas salina TaxID=1710540 RepID=UPI0015B59C23|nr:signal peptidase I [Natronomonas salina]QLD90677.1 signal peptidase I [Natronomonas salina]
MHPTLRSVPWLRTILVLGAAAMVLGAAFGQPVLLAYVETGSMEPTIETGDGFVVVPAVVAGDPEVGDVVVFQAESIQGGGPTTHRIVGETDRGYETRGDANPFTDQDGGEPYVTADRVSAKAVTVGGDPIVIPHLGTAIMSLEGALSTATDSIPVSGTSVLVALGALLIAAGTFLGGRSVDRDVARSRWRPGSYPTSELLLAGAVAFAGVTVAGTVLASGPAVYGLVAVDGGDVDDPLVVEPGGTTTLTRQVENPGLVPTVVVYDGGPGVESTPESRLVAPRGSASFSVTIAAPDEPARFERGAYEHHYPAVLPPSLIAALHGVHPWLALAATATVSGGAVVLVGRFVLPADRIRVRSSARRPW